MIIRMDGRAAVITGGSRGIGKAIAAEYLKSGASVAIVARDEATLKSAKSELEKVSDGGKVIAISEDLRTAEGCERVFKEAAGGLGKVDILVNCAGTSKRGPFVEIDDATWQDDLDLKLFAAIRLTRLAVPAMVERRWGRIINVLNTSAKAPGAQGAPTAVSRAAGMSLTKILAAEYVSHNVLVNALLVGKIRSDQWEKRHAKDERGLSLEDWYADQGKALPMKRLGTPEEFANMACLLASDAGSYITGTAINIDGGFCPVV